MSITQLKALTWFLSVGVAAFLGYFVYDFFQHQEALKEPVSTETQLAVLNSVPEVEPPKEDVVDYQDVLNTWFNMDWVGRPPAKPTETVAEEGPKKPTYKPVAELLKVLMVQVDGGNPKRSMAQVSFLDPALKAANPTPDDRVLHEGEPLEAPYESIRIARITRDGVLFEFEVGEDDDARDPEMVATTRFEGGERIVRVGPEGAIVPIKKPFEPYARLDKVVPQETKQVGDDHWWVGTDDRTAIAENYTKILSEIRLDKHRDSLGKVDGIEVKEVPKGAFAAKYGVKEGMVIKSINGHPISSVNEGISYAKQNQDKYDVWVILYEEQGKEKTKIIDTTGD